MYDNRSPGEKERSYLRMVERMVEEVRYGTISIVVQDGKVIQIEQNKKIRLRTD